MHNNFDQKTGCHRYGDVHMFQLSQHELWSTLTSKKNRSRMTEISKLILENKFLL
jgi:predicted Zn-dependent protease